MSETKLRGSHRRIIILVTIIFIVLVLALVGVLNLKNTQDLQQILKESTRSQLISISLAAREIIDPDEFLFYNSQADADRNATAYRKTLIALRRLAENVGAEYIYALKQVGNEYIFVFDTDEEDPEVFIPYALSPVHEAAFAGQEAADVLNVQDQYGSFNTGAVPIYKSGQIIGIVAVDLSDVYVQQSQKTGITNAIVLLAALIIAMGIMLAMLIWLLGQVGKMQTRLEHLAHHDAVTGLPNRQYLLEYLGTLAAAKPPVPYALLFIDLDNFKRVNDNAGHEAGDELLRHIAAYLNVAENNALSFRPSAGQLNIAARIGGDEFIQVISGVQTEEQAAAYAQKLLDNFTSKTIGRYVEKYDVGLSIGVALYPFHSENFHVLIKYADRAMYEAKRSGKNRFAVYQDEMGGDET